MKVGMLQKSLLTFAVSFGLSAMFSMLSLMGQLSFLTLISPSTITGISATAILTTLVFHLAGFASFFVVFYFLAKINQITAEKDTIFALLTGAILGPLTIYQLLQMLPLFPLNIAGLLVTSTLIYFVPALTALLLAKHKEKEMINAQPERPT
jgi:hypothetical protein